MRIEFETTALTDQDKDILFTLSGVNPFERNEADKEVLEELEVAKKSIKAYDKNLTKAKKEIKELKEKIKSLESAAPIKEETPKEVVKEEKKPEAVVTEAKQEPVQPKEVVNTVEFPTQEPVQEETYTFASVAEVGQFVQSYIAENHLLPTDIPQLTVTKLTEVFTTLQGMTATKQEVLNLIGIK